MKRCGLAGSGVQNTSDLGFDRVKAVEIFAFDDALFDTRTGNAETFADAGELVARLEDIIASGETIG